LPSAQTRTAAPIVVVVGNGKENLDGVSKLRQLKNQQLNLMQNQSDKSVFLNGTATPEHSSSNVGASLNIGSRHIASSINVLGNQQQQGCLLQLSLPPQGNVSSRAQRSHLDQHQQSMTWFYRPEESLLGSQLNLALQQQQKHNRTANSDVDLNCNHFNDGLVANEDREHPLARPPPPPPPPPVQSRIVVKLSFPPAEVAAIDRQIQSIEEPYSPQSHLFICQSFLRPPKPFNAFANFIDWFPSAEDFPDFVSAHRQQLVEGPDCLISLTRLLIMLDLERHLLALLQSRLLHPRVRMPGPSRFTLLHTACLADSVQCVTLLHKLDSSNCVKLLDASGRSLSAVASPTVRSKVRLSTSSVGSAATSMAVKAPLSLFKFLTPSSNQQKQKAEFNSGPVSLTPEQRIHALGLVTNPATHEELLVLANQGQLNISAVNGGDNALLHRCLEMGLSSLALLANLLRRKLLLTDSSSINRNNQSESPLSHQLIHLSQGWDSEYRQHYLACYLHLLKADLNAADSSLGRTALHLAALAADEDLTNFLLQHEVDFNLPDKAGALPDHLGFKCSGGNNPCTRLIERRRNQRSRVIAELVSRLPDQLAARFRHTDLFVTDPDGFTPLCLAAKCNSMSALQFLLDQPDCPIDGQHPATGRTALAMAAAEDNALAVRLLLEYGACPAVRDFEHRLALELAVSAGNAASVQAMLAYTACLTGLFEARAALQKQQHRHRSPRDSRSKDATATASAAETPIDRALTAASARRQRELVNPGLFGLAVSGCLASLSVSLEPGDDLNCRDLGGNWPLFLACSNGHVDAVRLLVDFPGVRLDLRHPADGSGVLHAACRQGHLQVVTVLLSLGSAGSEPESPQLPLDQIDQPNDRNERPIYLAAKRGSLSLVRYLLANGASPVIPEPASGNCHLYDGAPFEGVRYALEAARFSRFARLVTIMKSAKPVEEFSRLWQPATDWLLVDSAGRTVLMAAVELGSESVVNCLLDSTGSCQAPSDAIKHSNIIIANDNDYSNATDSEFFADSAVNSRVSRYVDHSIELADSRASICLLSRQCRMFGYTALHYCCTDFHSNATSSSRRRVLKSICQARIRIASSLVQRDPSLASIGDKNGLTALHLACQFGDRDMVQMLLQVAKIDPDQRTHNGHLPEELTNDRKIRDLIRQHRTRMVRWVSVDETVPCEEVVQLQREHQMSLDGRVLHDNPQSHNNEADSWTVDFVALTAEFLSLRNHLQKN
ncbi:hypothetical protein BOX15_Mlig004442g7, partial [Macrostomum lignano]